MLDLDVLSVEYPLYVVLEPVREGGGDEVVGAGDYGDIHLLVPVSHLPLQKTHF